MRFFLDPRSWLWMVLFVCTAGPVYAQTDAEWSVNLTIEASAGYGDFSTTFGVHPEATNGFDVRDVPEPPPPPGNAVSLFFPRPEWQIILTAFDQDFQAGLVDHETRRWPLRSFSTAASADFTLAWKAPALTDYTFTLVDFGTTPPTEVDMEADTTYAFSQSVLNRDFEIRVVRGIPAVLTLGTNTGWTTEEGGSIALTAAVLQATDSVQPAEAVRFRITAAQGGGALLRDGVTLAVDSAFTQADVEAGRLRYQHGGGEAPTDTITVTIDNQLGTPIPDVPLAVTVTPVNDAPVLAVNAGLTVVGMSGVLDASVLQVTDADDAAADLVFTLLAAPMAGDLVRGGTVLTQNDRFTQADLDAGQLTYEVTGTASADTFRFAFTDGEAPAQEATFDLAITVDAEAVPELPGQVRLLANYPNPFAEHTTLVYELPVAMPATLTVYDALGRVVAQPVPATWQAAGHYEVPLAGTALAPGLYFCRLTTPLGSTVQRLVRVR